jgi:hypothetical protein
MTRLIDKEFLQSRSYENEILKNITKKKVFAELIKNGFDPTSLLFIKKVNYKMARRFNRALQKTCLGIPMLMHEIILLLEEEFTTMNFLLMALNDRNKQIIKNECKSKYNINDDDCILFEILS